MAEDTFQTKMQSIVDSMTSEQAERALASVQAEEEECGCGQRHCRNPFHRAVNGLTEIALLRKLERRA